MTTLVQQGDTAVVGRSECVAGSSQGKRYEIEGTFVDRILTATYSLSDETRQQVERGVLALQLSPNGEVLEGFMIYPGDEAPRLYSVPIKMTLVEDEATRDAPPPPSDPPPPR